MIGARYLKADMERAFIDAYYRYVCGCKRVDFDDYAFGFVAAAATPDRAWIMDFSTIYERPLEMKQATLNRKLTENAAAAQRDGQFAAGVRGLMPPVPVAFEIWCFIPPSDRLLTGLEAARANGARITLVTMEQVQERVRQAVLAVPLKTDEDQAFVQAASMFRKAFGI